MSFSGSFGYNSFRPFLSLQKDGVPHENTPRNRKTMKYFPLDPKKHPVSILYEYCSLQDIEPIFQFYEIPQTIGIEYGVVVKVDRFSGSGRSFSKKTAKQLAALDILDRILQPNYYGDKDFKTKRFVSETGIISVHYEQKMDPPVIRSCIKSANKSSAATIKRVKFLDANDGDVKMDEEAAADQAELPLSDTETELMYSDEEDTEIQTEKPEPAAADDLKLDGVKLKKKKEEFQDNENSLIAEPIVGEIDDYLSQRLLKTNISHPTQKEDADSSDEVEVVKFSDPKQRKRKCSSPVPFEKTRELKRKVCFRDINPVGYLQEACQRLRIPLPEYVNLKEHGAYKTVCILEEHKELGKGITSKAAKKKAAALMIEHKGW